MWSLITSTVLDSEGGIPGDDDGDDDVGDDGGDATVVTDGDSLEAAVGCGNNIFTSGEKGVGAQEAGGVDTEIAVASGEQKALPGGK